MHQQLLWIEIVLKFGIGLVLLLAPRTLARILGLPATEESFWPRVAAALLIGIAGAAFVELQLLPGKAMGLSGLVAINLTLAVVLGSLLILGKAGAAKRARIAIGLSAGLLTLSALVAIVSAL